MSDRFDVAIVGGGPAGSSCAWRLTQAGARVVVVDQKRFPRNKTCASWVTLPVFDLLQIDHGEYGNGRVHQAINGFRTGVIGGSEVETCYGKIVGYGIRRCEFDTWLLNRSGATLRTGYPVRSLVRRSGCWQINGTWEAPFLVGAGGHFCPVARMLGAREVDGAKVVTAQETEFEAGDSDLANGSVLAETPELFFCNDLNGYGWCFRKGSLLNIGLGRIGSEHLTSHVEAFVDFLRSRGKVVATLSDRFHGHAYQLYERRVPRLYAEGVLLVGDAAGLAHPQSGEGIRPAVESGLIAAEVIRNMHHHSGNELKVYSDLIEARFAQTQPWMPWARLPDAWLHWAARQLLRNPWFTRRFVLDNWFLGHAA